MIDLDEMTPQMLEIQNRFNLNKRNNSNANCNIMSAKVKPIDDIMMMVN